MIHCVLVVVSLAGCVHVCLPCGWAHWVMKWPDNVIHMREYWTGKWGGRGISGGLLEPWIATCTGVWWHMTDASLPGICWGRLCNAGACQYSMLKHTWPIIVILSVSLESRSAQLSNLLCKCAIVAYFYIILPTLVVVVQYPPPLMPEKYPITSSWNAATAINSLLLRALTVCYCITMCHSSLHLVS